MSDLKLAVAKDPNPTISSVFLEFCSRGELGLKLEKRTVSDEEDNAKTLFFLISVACSCAMMKKTM